MRNAIALLLLPALWSCTPQQGVHLKPGYDPAELTRLLPAMERTYDSADIGGFKTPEPVDIQRVFRSSTTPLMNRFDVWKTTDGKAVFTFRGTIVDTAALSFSAAFYSLMVPGAGKLRLADSTWFEYKLAELPGAGVHLGILLGLALISEELTGQVQAQYNDGIRDIILLGHSQGSGISLMATSYLMYLQKAGRIPAGIRFKTYSIATPKVGNYSYVCDFEKLTSGGYAFSVDNVIDWVPFIAMTFQSAGDFPPVSPFRDLRAFMTDINYPPGPDFDSGYAKFARVVPALTEQMIGVIRQNVYPRIHRALPGFSEPEIMKSYNFERAGIHVPLVPDSAYYKLFPNDPRNFRVWENHSVYPYYILVSSK